VLWSAGDRLVQREIARAGLLWRALRDFDVIHFNFGHPITPIDLTPEKAVRGSAQRLNRTAAQAYIRLIGLRDLPLLKAAGKKVFVTYQGDDARQGDSLHTHFEVNPLSGVDHRYYTPASDRRKRSAIAHFDRYADRIYALNPDLLHVLPPRATFLPYASVDPRDWVPAAPPGLPGRPLVVAHAPTHRGVKGTEAILSACRALTDEGVSFELDVIEGVTRAEARARYERADLLVDQLLVGWYGGVAVEVMALGRPTIAFIRDRDLSFVPSEMRVELPVITATEATITEVLREWLTTRRREISEAGRRSREFVERWHDPMRIAARLKADYEQT
jgi:hypothetical protein